MYSKEDLKKAYNSGASNQEMQDAGLEGMTSFDDWFLWTYGKAENLPISDVIFCSCLNPIRGEDRTNGHSCQYCLKKIKEW